jgi:hypothetical protein
MPPFDTSQLWVYREAVPDGKEGKVPKEVGSDALVRRSARHAKTTWALNDLLLRVLR